MKNKKKSRNIGSILIVIAIFGLVGNFSEFISSLFTLQPGMIEVYPQENLFPVMFTFMLLIGGILLLIPFKDKFLQKTTEKCEDDCVNPDIVNLPIRRNGVCTVALVFAILSIAICATQLYEMFSIIPLIVPIISLVLGFVGLKQAILNNEKGEGFAKWGIAAGIASILAIIYLYAVNAIVISFIK